MSTATIVTMLICACGAWLLALVGRREGEPIRSYRPEAHYMRGPGPAWRAKHRPN